MSYNELIQRGTEDFPIELYSLDYRHARYEMSDHWHSEIELIRIISGSLTVKLNNRSYCACEGDIIFVNPETLHQATPNECVYECIVLNPECVSDFSNSSISFIDGLKNHEYAVTEYHNDKNSDFSKKINELFDTLKCKTSGYKYTVIGILYSIFGEIINLKLYSSINSVAVSDSKNALKLKAVLSYIRENYSDGLTLDDIASVADMSPKYFCSFFKQMTSKTPMEYLILYRIEKASLKLINSDLSITATAFSCGFNDLSYFIKTFKRIKGISPAKYRKKFDV